MKHQLQQPKGRSREMLRLPVTCAPLQEIEQQQRDRSYQLAQIKAKIAAVKQQLSLVSVVTSPYTGTVKVIKVQKQTNNSLAVEITLAVSGSTGVPNSGSDRHPRKRDAPSPIS